MFVNYIVAYNMSEKIERITASSDKKLVLIELFGNFSF
jgi:hypothetical protein